MATLYTWEFRNLNEMDDAPEPQPSLSEEVANSMSHGVGLVAAFVAGPLLIARAAAHGRPWGTISASVFLATVVVMYLASTLYHALPLGRAKRIFRKLEHGAIFLLIAGTYTPFTLVACAAPGAGLFLDWSGCSQPRALCSRALPRRGTAGCQACFIWRWPGLFSLPSGRSRKVCRTLV